MIAHEPRLCDNVLDLVRIIIQFSKGLLPFLFSGWGYKKTSRGYPEVQRLQELMLPAVDEAVCAKGIGKTVTDTNVRENKFKL